MAVSAFRRSVVADTKKKGGGGKGAYYEKLKIPVNIPTSLIMVRGQYVDPHPPVELIELDPQGRAKPVINPYYKVKLHKRATNRNGKPWYPSDICSEGLDPHNPQPCVGCHAMQVGDKSVSLTDAFVFGIVHLAYYHGHPMADKDKPGQFVTKKDNSGFVMITSECSGRTCNFCRILSGQLPFPPAQGDAPFPSYDPRTITTVYGKKRYLELGKNHLSDIQGFDQIIMSQCGACKQTLVTDGFACPNCHNLVIDMNNVGQQTDEQIGLETLKPYPCMTCQRPVLLQEVVACDFCENQGRKGVQLSIFDVVLQAMRQGESTNSHVVRQNHMTVEEFGSGIDPRFLEGKTLRQHIEELSKDMYKFDEVYKPKTLQEQSKNLELPMPPGFGQPPAAAPYAAYGAPPQQQFSPPPPGYAPPQQQQFTPPAPGGYTQAPAYVPYNPVQQPQPAPGPQGFQPPVKPNYGR